MESDDTPLLERIAVDPEVLAGQPAIKGTRISVALILEYLTNNPNFDEFFRDYPELTMADVRAAFAYARDAVARRKRPQLAYAITDPCRLETASTLKP